MRRRRDGDDATARSVPVMTGVAAACDLSSCTPDKVGHPPGAAYPCSASGHPWGDLAHYAR